MKRVSRGGCRTRPRRSGASGTTATSTDAGRAASDDTAAVETAASAEPMAHENTES